MWVVAAENRLNRKLSALFKKVGDRSVEMVIAKSDLSPEMRAQLIDYIKTHQDEVKQIFHEGINKAATEGGKKAVTHLNEQGMKVSFHDFSKSTHEILDKKAFTASETTMEKVTGRVMDNLKESYDNGYGIDKAAQNLQSEFEGISKSGLKRIARTEINSAQNTGAHQKLVDLGVEYEQWWTAQDDRVRDGSKGGADHVALHGQIVRLDDPFENGLIFPGDMSGDISEWIECRCTEVPFIMPRGMTAPDKPYFTEDELVPIESDTS